MVMSKRGANRCVRRRRRRFDRDAVCDITSGDESELHHHIMVHRRPLDRRWQFSSNMLDTIMLRAQMLPKDLHNHFADLNRD